MIDDSPFPDNIARGISNSDCIKTGGIVPKCVFQFSWNKQEGISEMSIQCLDNEESVAILKRYYNAGRDRPKYGPGFLVLKTDSLEIIRSSGVYPGFDYYRVPNYSGDNPNPYHGHIVISSEDKVEIRQLASDLALNSSFYSYDSELPYGK